MMAMNNLAVQVTPTDMRSAMARVPTPVAVVAAMSPTGPVAMVVGSFVSVSLEPPLVGFFVTGSSTSWPKLRDSGHLGISALAADHEDFCHKITRKHPDRFASLYWQYRENRPPLVHDAVAGLTCTVESVTTAGDHEFVLCRVEHLEVGSHPSAMVFHDRAFASVVPASAAPPMDLAASPRRHRQHLADWTRYLASMAPQ